MTNIEIAKEYFEKYMKDHNIDPKFCDIVPAKYCKDGLMLATYIGNIEVDFDNLEDIKMEVASSEKFKEAADYVMANLTVGPSNMVDIDNLFHDMFKNYLLRDESGKAGFSAACCLLTGKYLNEIADMIFDEYEKENEIER